MNKNHTIFKVKKFRPVRSEENKNPLEVLNEKWSKCTLCPLGRRARNHVLYEVFGDWNIEENNCDVMMIGEGPGESEDILGQPFVGRSGKLLRSTIHRTGGNNLNILITNLVACRPQECAYSRYNREPAVSEIESCFPRVLELVDIFKPRNIITLGKIPQGKILNEWDKLKGIEIFHLWHPSYVERSGGITSEKGAEYMRRMREVFETIKNA